MKRWPPYLISFATFIALGVVFMLVANAVISSAVSRGVLPEMPSPKEMSDAIDVALGSPAKTLAISIVVNALLVAGIAIAASSAGVRARWLGPVLVRRLRLEPPAASRVVIALLGLIGLTTALDSMVQLLDLSDVGTLADIKAAIDPLSPAQKLVFAALIGIGPGVTEELFFRGYLFNRIAVAQGTRVALVWSSLIFGLFHLDPVHTPLAIVMGFYLGLCLLHTGSLWVPIAAHLANNMMAALTTGWAPTELQAALLVPLGMIAGGSAIALLARGERLVPRRPVVW